MITKKQKIELKEKLELRIFKLNGEITSLIKELNEKELLYLIYLVKQDYIKVKGGLTK